jgi:hypothetical protein
MSDDDLDTVMAMKRWGGGFAFRLAEAALVADSENLRRIKDGWPEMWVFYGRLAADDKLKTERDGERQR